MQDSWTFDLRERDRDIYIYIYIRLVMNMISLSLLFIDLKSTVNQATKL
jgi:hypothetical protein